MLFACGVMMVSLRFGICVIGNCVCFVLICCYLTMRFVVGCLGLRDV